MNFLTHYYIVVQILCTCTVLHIVKAVAHKISSVLVVHIQHKVALRVLLSELQVITIPQTLHSCLHGSSSK